MLANFGLKLGQFEAPAPKSDILTFLENRKLLGKRLVRLLIYLKVKYGQKRKEINFSTPATRCSLFSVILTLGCLWLNNQDPVLNQTPLQPLRRRLAWNESHGRKMKALMKTGWRNCYLRPESNHLFRLRRTFLNHGVKWSKGVKSSATEVEGLTSLHVLTDDQKHQASTVIVLFKFPKIQ